MYSSEFDYVRATSLAEAIDLIAKNPDARLLAGGHSLIPAMKLRLAAPSMLIDIGGLDELRGITALDDGTIEIGAMTTHDSIATSEDVRNGCPLLSETAVLIGDQQVRNCGTIGGALAHADPAADYPTAVMALDATMTARSDSGKRTIVARSFFVERFTSALQPGGVLTSIRMPSYGKGTGGVYLKHKHPASSFAVVGVAALLTLENGKCSRARVVIGGVTTNPVHATEAEEALMGSALDEESLAAASAKVPASLEDPMGDIYASGEYRQHLATVLTRRALEVAVERAQS